MSEQKSFLWELTRQAPLREAILCPKSLVAWHWQDNWEDHATTQYTNTTDEIKLTVTSVSGVERIDRWKKWNGDFHAFKNIWTGIQSLSMSGCYR